MEKRRQVGFHVTSWQTRQKRQRTLTSLAGPFWEGNGKQQHLSMATSPPGRCPRAATSKTPVSQIVTHVSAVVFVQQLSSHEILMQDFLLNKKDFTRAVRRTCCQILSVMFPDNKSNDLSVREPKKPFTGCMLDGQRFTLQPLQVCCSFGPRLFTFIYDLL